MKKNVRRSDATRDVSDELRFHLDMRTREFIEAGYTPDEARRAAMDAFGDVDAIGAELRAARGTLVRTRERRERWGELASDLMFAVRTLRKNAGFTLAALATLALGIGAAVAVFTVADGVLLRPLPYADPSRLAMIWIASGNPPEPGDLPISGGFYTQVERQGTKAFSGVAAFRSWPYTVTSPGEAEEVRGARVAPSLAAVLGVRPEKGRWFTDTDADSGAAPVVVLSHSLWQRKFAGDASIVGRTIDLGGTPYRVIGIMPAGFSFPRGAELIRGLQFGLRTEIWTPLQLSQQDRTNYGTLNMAAIGRLRGGTTLPQAQGELHAVMRAFLEANAPTLKLDYRIVDLQTQAGQTVRRGLYLLMGAVGFLLFIACANVANLLVARTGTRRREFAMRATLGAGRGRIVRQLITENLLLALVGSALGMAVAEWATRAMLAMVPGTMPRADDVSIDWRIAIATVVVAMAIGAAFGLAAGSQVRWGQLAETLRDSGSRATGGRAHGLGRRALVVAEVSLSLMLIIGASLLATSFARLQRIDPGITPGGVLTASITLPIGASFDPSNGPVWARFFRELDDRMSRATGVESFGAVSALPLSDAAEGGAFALPENPPPKSGQAPHTAYLVIQGNYFRTMGIRLVAGRFLDGTDGANSERVVVVNREFVKKYLGASPIGRQIIPYFDFSRGPRTVVGVVENVQYGSLDTPMGPQAYVPEQQMSYPGLNIVVRGQGDPRQLLPVLKREVRAIDPRLAVSRPRPMTEVFDESLARRRFSMTLIGVFAASALVLAMVGLYGVIALSVSQRQRELGVRVALGAQASDVLRLVLGEGMRITLVGAAIGLAGAVALSRLVTSLLYDVSPTSVGIYGFATLVVIAVTLAATLVPALRATRVDPSMPLRGDG